MMKVTVTYPLNKRINQPFTLANNRVGTLKTGDTIEVATEVAGQFIEGNNTWLKDTDGYFYWSGGTNYQQVMMTQSGLPTSVSQVVNEATATVAGGLNYAERVVNLPDEWKRTKGTGITVAVLDSGINMSHPGLQKAVLKYHNLANSIVGGDATDIVGHGTKVTGIIASNSTTADGITGIAPECNIINYKVTNDTSVDGQFLAKALDKLYELAQTINIKVINLSLDVSPSDYTDLTYSNGEKIEHKIDKLISKNIIIVAAGGNNNQLTRNEILYPAMHPDVLSVGAINTKLNSPFNKRVDFIFQNLLLKSTAKDGSYNDSIKQCSAYTGVLSAIVAALLSANPLANKPGKQKVAAVKEILRSYSFDSNNFTDETVSGLIKIYKNIST